MLRAFLLIIGLLFGWATPSYADSQVNRPHVSAALISHSRTIAPGEVITLAITLAPKPGWHTYFKNYGDTGAEVHTDWVVPAGFVVGPLQYPTPIRLETGGVVNYGYDTAITLPFTLRAPAQFEGTQVPLKVELNWLVCSEEVCVPQNALLDLSLTRGPAHLDPAMNMVFSAAQAALPKPVTWRSRFSTEDTRLRLQVDLEPGLPPIKEAFFFPYARGITATAAPQQMTVADNTLTIETESVMASAPPKAIEGILRLTTQGSAHAEGFRLSATHVPHLPAPTSPQALSVGLAFVFAVLGGLMLNLMPCVFPILSLKALTLARSGADARQAQHEALFYTLGVVLSFVVLGGALFALRAAGAQIGWGFQLQDPRVVGFLAVLMVLVALNLFGVFEVNTALAGRGQSLTQAKGAQGSFWTGALAVLVATPCTAPFMAGALGAALTLPLAAGLMIFVGLGLGMALPFIAIGYSPALHRLLPRPGAWMATFRSLLGFPMLATALWLLSVVGQQAGQMAMVAAMLACLVVAFAAWLYGHSHKNPALWLKILAAVVFIAGVVIPARLAPQHGQQSAMHTAARPYSEAALAAARATGQPVFVYFTAEWCISCKVNEKTTLSRESLVQAFQSKHVIVLVGDWTNRDSAITSALTRYGRSGVPLYLWFKPGASEPVILPQILTLDLMLDLVNQLG